MVTVEDLSLYFYIACGVEAGLFLVIFVIICVFCVKISRLTMDGSYNFATEVGLSARFPRRSEHIPKCLRTDQLERQTTMMANFCYTNPMIVPGEELDRRGFSMYSGADTFGEEYGMRNKDISFGTCHEARSKF